MPVQTTESFTAFARTSGERVRLALVASFGPELGADATSEALAYAWQHWERMSEMDNGAGYLYTVGRNWARRQVRRRRMLPRPENDGHSGEHWVEPGLAAALGTLTSRQSAAVLLVHGFGWTLQEASEVLGIGRSTVQKHVDRAMDRLRGALGVSDVS